MADHTFIRTIAAAALSRFDSVVDWLGIGGGKSQGREYLPLNPKRADTKPGSFTINRDSGAWADFADDAKGGDLVGLCAYLHGIKQGEAAARLAGFLGIEKGDALKHTGSGAPERGHAKGSIAPKQTQGAADSQTIGDACIMPAPDDAPRPPESHLRHGKSSRR